MAIPVGLVGIYLTSQQEDLKLVAQETSKPEAQRHLLSRWTKGYQQLESDHLELRVRHYAQRKAAGFAGSS